MYSIRAGRGNGKPVSGGAGGGRSNRVYTGLPLDLSVARGPNKEAGGAGDARSLWRCGRGVQKPLYDVKGKTVPGRCV